MNIHNKNLPESTLAIARSIKRAACLLSYQDCSQLMILADRKVTIDAAVKYGAQCIVNGILNPSDFSEEG